MTSPAIHHRGLWPSLAPPNRTRSHLLPPRLVSVSMRTYQLPIALSGLISCLALWDVFKFGGDQWGLDRYPIIRQTLVRIAQCVTAVILLISNVQLAVFSALGVSYAVMILHASFRKLTPAKQPAVRGGYRRTARR
ncbi:UNVERIFIED_CONTAM: PRA1 family protein H [Sesamum radiatum]|uniref:PRA1 family protein H n=1 Tax=Sesamum radiatum TaxID=300843 RepID=A0AAW2KHZ9_SESRA